MWQNWSLRSVARGDWGVRSSFVVSCGQIHFADETHQPPWSYMIYSYEIYTAWLSENLSQGFKYVKRTGTLGRFDFWHIRNLQLYNSFCDHNGREGLRMCQLEGVLVCPITGRSAGRRWKLDRLINWAAEATITTTCAGPPCSRFCEFILPKPLVQSPHVPVPPCS